MRLGFLFGSTLANPSGPLSQVLVEDFGPSGYAQ
jgi:hypothetical protein